THPVPTTHTPSTNYADNRYQQPLFRIDPFDGHGLSITAFCEQLKISRRTFYNIRARYDEEAGGALHPHSSAPITPARTYDEHVTTALPAIRKRLKGQGWDYGPISIRFEGIASGELTALPILVCMSRFFGGSECRFMWRGSLV
ncbi:helix-turn-helix domain-containing protein, partial [Corynebacterium pyruviciproducens]